MQFEYSAKSIAGQLMNGELDADSLESARRMLRDRDLFVTALKPAHQAAVSMLAKRKSVTKRDLLMLTSQLSIMCQTGVDLAEAIESCAKQTTSVKLREALEFVHKDISDGMSVPRALRKHVDIFGETYIASVAAGEASGQMGEVLDRMAGLLRTQIRLRSTINGALGYPIVLTGVSLIVLSALIFFVLPQFGKIFEDMEIPAPMSTRFLLAVSSQLRTYTLYWAGGLVALLVGGLKAMKSNTFRRLVDRQLLNAFLIREVVRALFIGRTFRLMATMLESGVPLLEAIRLCKHSIQNIVYRDMFDQLETEVLNGRGIAETLAKCDFVPSGAAQMVNTAERTGRLGSVMTMIGEFYEEEGERRVQEMSKLLEPIIIVLMGAVVAFIVASVMLPMLSFSTASKG